MPESSKSPVPPAAPSTNTGWWGKVRSPLLQGGFLMLIWALLSGKYDWFHQGLGVATVVLVLWVEGRLERLGGSKARPVIDPVRWVGYYFWLLWQMILAAILVARVVLQPQGRLDPQLVKFRCEQPNVFAAVALANSITLTPGTLTVEYQDGHYLVHALSKRTARDLLNGAMQTRVARVFHGKTPSVVEQLPVDTSFQVSYP